MATQTKSRGRLDDPETVERIRELNEKIIENAREAGDIYLDAYERTLKAIVDYQRGAASATPADWLKRVLDVQADFTRELGDLYASAAREALQKR